MKGSSLKYVLVKKERKKETQALCPPGVFIGVKELTIK